MGFIVVLVIGVGLAAGGLGLFDGSIHANWYMFITGVLLLGIAFIIGGIFSRDHNHDRDVNGEIEAKLQGYTDEHYRLVQLARAGQDVEVQLCLLEHEMKVFESTIEYGVVTDGAENYYSYKKGVR